MEYDIPFSYFYTMLDDVELCVCSVVDWSSSAAFKMPCVQYILCSKII